MLEKVFKLKSNGTTVRTELVAGLTTFMTMAYIIALNPNLLTNFDTGSPLWNGVFMATCVASFVGMLCMAFIANKPFALAPGMGLNAYFAYTVVLTYGYSWQIALLAVFAEGIIFILLSLFGVREAIINSIPVTMKKAVSVGIGLFITIIGLVNAGICSPDTGTPIGFVNFSMNHASALVAILGFAY